MQKGFTKEITGKRIAAFFLTVVMTVAFMPVLGIGKAEAATPKGRLVKSVTQQYYDKGTKSWEKEYVYSFKYNKRGDPVTITRKTYSESGKLIDTNKWTEKYTYKKGKRAKRVEKWNYHGAGDTEKWTYDKYGNPKTGYIKDGSMTRNVKCSFSKSGYLRAETFKEDYGDGQIYNDKYSFKTSLKNGLPTKMTCRYYDNDSGKWVKSSAYRFNKKGLATKYKSASGADCRTFKYTYKKGRVAAATVTNTTDPNNVTKQRYKFTYTKKAVKKKRYAKMINHIIESGDEFAWY